MGDNGIVEQEYPSMGAAFFDRLAHETIKAFADATDRTDCLEHAST